MESKSKGDLIVQRMWNRTVQGVTGNVSIDANGDRNADYALLDMDPKSGEVKVGKLMLKRSKVSVFYRPCCCC